ncbi:Bifunctional autolysin precursor [Planctomycetes bacterium CA13]|uniref:Bifunctional autolysin n=2 Tax=Novipirellula herctigrandis TaxID=2527986 RepID=A0A5C5Z4V1_9BACT|nr:Bifunctional autolysin precursor [Planctomycetes bacterium CA13]
MVRFVQFCGKTKLPVSFALKTGALRRRICEMKSILNLVSKITASALIAAVFVAVFASAVLGEQCGVAAQELELGEVLDEVHDEGLDEELDEELDEGLDEGLDVDRYNAAVENYQSGDFLEAAQQFERLVGADSSEIAARARFNLGSCHYQHAVAQTDQDPKSAIANLLKAIGRYREVLAIAPDDQDARANIELAMQLLNQQQQEQQQENSQQDQQQQSEESESSESEPSSSQDGESQQQQDESQQDDSQQSESNENNSQQDSGESDSESDSESSQQDQESSESNDSEASESGAKEDDSKQAGSQQQRQSETDPPESDSQPSSSESPSNAEGELSAANPQNQQQTQSGDSEDREPVVIGQMTEVEANKMLQAIRDRELLRELRREQMQRRRHIPVDKDW